LRVTLFFVAMAEITHEIEEPIKIIGYADDWIIIHTTHKHERVSVLKLQLIEKTMFSRKNTAIASRPRLDIWIKGTKIEQVSKHKILGLIFDTRMDWNEHILTSCLAHSKWGGGTDQENVLTIHKMIILRTLRYGEEAYGSASKAVLKKLEPTHNRGIRLALGVFAVCHTENALCKAGVSTLADMRNLNATITVIRFISNPNHPIRPFCLNSTCLEEYAL
jgi:hypothetical protein